tara:strand:+ start:985 stop:1299 length:315 start_codon:yes stop_codon:yes gene_type:complete
MKKNNNWDHISQDIAEVAKKIKDKTGDEDLVEDLKESMKNTVQNTSDIFKNIIETIDSTIKDEEIKNETLEIVKKINIEIKKNVSDATTSILNLDTEDFLYEEE